MYPTYRAARLLPLGALLLIALGSCQDNSLPTAPLSLHPKFTQVAASPVVNSLNDPGTGTCDDTECTLREAISFANSGATITFSVTGTITLTNELVLDKNLTIAGPTGSTITISGNNAHRVFYVAQYVAVTLNYLTITGGNAVGTAPAVYPEGGWGGGIVVDQGGELTVRNSTISGNHSGSYRGGGGIANLRGTLTVEKSTISGNSASWYGGGIYAYGATTIKNSTISGNSTTDNFNTGGGGVFNYWITYILYSTISGNSSGGVDIHNSATKASIDTRMKGSIIAGNSNGDITSTYTTSGEPVLYTSLGYNVIGSATDLDYSGVFLESDQTGVSNPGVDALANNGGPTRTHALQAGSPALDFIPAISCTDNAGTAVTVDQRGISRPQGSSCDIGAFELEVSSGTTPTFTFDLSSLPAKTFGDGTFYAAAGGYVNTNSTGAITFATGAGSVGCSVTSGGTVTITGAAVDPSACILEASLAADATYTSAGPLQQSFHIAKAPNSVTINNMPASGTVGGSFTPTYTTLGDGTASATSNDASVCTVTDGVVNYIAAGTCVLAAWVTEGTNHLSATGTDQSFTISGGTVPTFAFDLSGLSAKTFGDGTFSVASYATSNSTGAITFALGTSSVGCSVTSAGMVTISGAAVDPSHCVIAATLAAHPPYIGAGPIEQSFNIAKATGSVTISNLPASGIVGGSFTPTYTKSGDGTASTVSNSTGVCTVTDGVVNYIAAGTCLLQASVTAGTNHLAATGTEQSFTISGVVPTFAFDLSGISSKTYGDGTFSVASYATSNSTGAITFALGTSSVGCSVTSAGMVTISGAAVDPSHCVIAATQAAHPPYGGAGPIEQSFNIAKATGSVTISNMPTSPTAGDQFTPTYSKSGDGIASVASLTTSVCTVAAGVVNFITAGNCILQASVTEGTNYQAATGAQQSVTVSAPVFTSSCTYTINAKNDQRQVTVSWANASPGVTQIQISDGRIATKQLAPTPSGSWSTNVKTGTPAYGLWGGTSRRDTTTVLQAAGSSCTLQ